MGLPEAKADKAKLAIGGWSCSFLQVMQCGRTVYREAARHATILTAVEWQSWQFQVISD